jgi:hypothetical protein
LVDNLVSINNLNKQIKERIETCQETAKTGTDGVNSNLNIKINDLRNTANSEIGSLNADYANETDDAEKLLIKERIRIRSEKLDTDIANKKKEAENDIKVINSALETCLSPVKDLECEIKTLQ